MLDAMCDRDRVDSTFTASIIKGKKMNDFNSENCVLTINGQEVATGSQTIPARAHIKDNGCPARKALIERIKTFDKDKALSLGYMIERYSDGSVSIDNFPKIENELGK